MLIPHRYSRIIPIAIFLFVSLCLFATYKSPHLLSTLSRSPPPSNECLPEFTYLKKLGLTDDIKWTRRRITPHFSDLKRDMIQQFAEKLIDHQANVNLATCMHDAPRTQQQEQMTLLVQKPYPKEQYPHLIFGVASSSERLHDSLFAMKHWLARTNAQLVAVVVDVANDTKSILDDLDKAYREAGIKAVFIAPTLKQYIPLKTNDDKSTDHDVPVEHHHFVLVRNMLDYATAETEWLGILDDDTFFPSLYPMNQELKKYDWRKPHWLGGLSEDFEHVRIWGLMSFGGAGTFLSFPLAAQLQPLLEECIVEANVHTGDGLLRDCIYMKTKTKLTVIPHMYQHDMLGDVSGFYESGIAPLSLHHWKSWYSEPIVEQAAISNICGDCYLSRWQFWNDQYLSVGYSINVYKHETIKAGGVNFDLLEGTWDFPAHPLKGDEYDFSFGPLRPKLSKEEKKSYKLVTSVENKHINTLTQIYVFRGARELGEVDEVVELEWGVGY
jgi:hypothetical protein